jgi:hypothetical protein
MVETFLPASKTKDNIKVTNTGDRAYRADLVPLLNYFVSPPIGNGTRWLTDVDVDAGLELVLAKENLGAAVKLVHSQTFTKWNTQRVGYEYRNKVCTHFNLPRFGVVRILSTVLGG